MATTTTTTPASATTPEQAKTEQEVKMLPVRRTPTGGILRTPVQVQLPDALAEEVARYCGAHRITPAELFGKYALTLTKTALPDGILTGKSKTDGDKAMGALLAATKRMQASLRNAHLLLGKPAPTQQAMQALLVKKLAGTQVAKQFADPTTAIAHAVEVILAK